MGRLFGLALVLAVTGLAVVAGCGGDERLSREEFSERMQSIDQRGGEFYGRVAQLAAELQPDESFPAGLEQALRELVEFQKEAVEELEGMNPPDDAEPAVDLLVGALRDRTETFEHAIEAGRFTEEDFDQVTQAGNKIDEALEQLRQGGFLP